jgi:hypothetical protein
VIALVGKFFLLLLKIAVTHFLRKDHFLIWSLSQLDASSVNTHLTDAFELTRLQKVDSFWFQEFAKQSSLLGLSTTINGKRWNENSVLLKYVFFFSTIPILFLIER